MKLLNIISYVALSILSTLPAIVIGQQNDNPTAYAVQNIMKKIPTNAKSFSPRENVLLNEKYNEDTKSISNEITGIRDAAKDNGNKAAKYESDALCSKEKIATYENNAKNSEFNTRQFEAYALAAKTKAIESSNGALDAKDNALKYTNDILRAKETADTAAFNAKKYESNAYDSKLSAQNYQNKALDEANNAYEYAVIAKKNKDSSEYNLGNINKFKDASLEAFEVTKNNQNKSHNLLNKLNEEILMIGSKIAQGNDNIIRVGQHLSGNYISIAGKEGNRVLSDLSDGVLYNDAVNLSQLNSVKNIASSSLLKSERNSLRISDLEDKFVKNKVKVNRGIASSVALNGLFQPYNIGKINLTTSIGGYGSSQALAIGTGYRVDQNLAFRAGVAFSGANSIAYNASFNIEW